MKLYDLYFSFVGGCKGTQIEVPEIEIENLHFRTMFDMGTGGELVIYDSPHPKFYFGVEVLYRDVPNYDTGSYERERFVRWYLIKKNSFDACPAVPVQDFADIVLAANL